MLQDLRQSDSFRTGAGQNFATELTDAALALRAVDGRMLVREKRAGSLLGDKHFADFEFAIGANHGVWVNGQVNRESTHRRQLIARPQGSCCDAAQHLIDDLTVSGNAAVGIQSELEAPVGNFRGRRQALVY